MSGLIDVPALLRWFERHGKSYPWGEAPTPYRVWVSEVMLQQTVITTVIPYFDKWMAAFPDVASLARAEEERVLRLWEGLGYYSRARHLLQAARILVRENGGRLPGAYPRLVALPGIGPYTAAAILSLAFGQPLPVLDANVLRILQRLLARPVADGALRKKLGERLAGCIPPERPGLFNQALMQLGQLVCRRQAPLCEHCPLATTCLARQQGLTGEIPAPRRKRLIHKETQLAVCVWDGQCYVIEPAGGRFRGLGLFPGFAQQGPGSELRALLDEAAQALTLQERDHYYTHYCDHLRPVLYLFARKPCLVFPGGRWLPLAGLGRQPFPSVYRKIVAEALQRLQAAGTLPATR